MMKQETPAAIPYSNRFQDSADVEAYESEEYSSTSYSSCIWRLQQPVLTAVLTQFGARQQGQSLRLLDFACGSGRILSVIEGLVGNATGVDISAGMAEVARKKCKKAEVRVGDILQQRELLQGPYDVITSFRFLLNVESDLRHKALRRLREVIRTPDGLLVVNVHGNSGSLRHPAIWWKQRQKKSAPAAPGAATLMLNEMSLAETRALLADSGFEIVQMLGFGILPPTLYRTPLRGLARMIDQFCAKRQWFTRWSVDLMFVCRPK
ncbi:MAG: class I SAM-dependent methyltransferase [Verrucomicrobiota bacterium]